MALTGNVLDGGIAFNEWLEISNTTDYNGDGVVGGAREKYFEFVNIGPSTINISGYQFFHIPNTAPFTMQLAHTVEDGITLAPGATYTIVSNNDTLTAATPANITGEAAVADIVFGHGFVNMILANPAGQFIVLQSNGADTYLAQDIADAGLNIINQIGIDVVNTPTSNQSIARTTDGDVTFTLQSPSPGEPNCFLAGTRIATPLGLRVIDQIGPGDEILTASGQVVPVLWVAKKDVSTMASPVKRLMPVRILAGALGDGLPVADLTVTADHAVMIKGFLVNAGVLVNGKTIISVPFAAYGQNCTVYHIEIADHDVILAEGVPAESFIDYSGRQAFDNYSEYLALYGDDRPIREMPVPRIAAHRHLPKALRVCLELNEAPAELTEAPPLGHHRAA